MDLAENLLMEKLQLSATPIVERPIAVVAEPPKGRRALGPPDGGALNEDKSRKDGYSHDSASRFEKAVAHMKAIEASRPLLAPILLTRHPLWQQPRRWKRRRRARRPSRRPGWTVSAWLLVSADSKIK